MKTEKLVMTAMMMCIIAVTTLFFKIPIPFANGYVHLGDAMIFMAVSILGMKNGAIAAATGSAMGDVLGGFGIWAPWTFVIKGAMAVIMGLFLQTSSKKAVNRIIGMGLSGMWMTAGYFVAEGLIYGNWTVALIGAPWNVGQFVTGMIVAGALSGAIYKTPTRKYFVYREG